MSEVDLSTDRTRIKPVNWGERGLGEWIARKFTYADFAASADIINLIPMPANSFVASLLMVIQTAFDGTPVLVVGDGNTADGYGVSGEIEETNAALVSDLFAPDATGAFVLKTARPFYTSADTIDVKFSWSTTPTAGVATLIAQIVTVPG